MLDLIKGIQSILEASMAVKPKERVLVIADDEGRSTAIGHAISHAATLVGAEPVLIIIPQLYLTRWEEGATEPPASVAAAMKNVDVIFRVSEKINYAHTQARKEASDAGIRYYIIGQIPVDDLKQGVSAKDLRLIQERTDKVAESLTKAKGARIKSPLGTNLTLDLSGREGLAFTPLSQVVGGLPYYAEAAIVPVRGTAEGMIVIDLAILQWGYRLRDPLRITVRGGKVADISGSTQEAERLRRLVATDENASNIAELGIGTSHIIPWAIHGTRRDAGRIGTVHIGFGRNDDIGGEAWSRIHQDGLIDRITLELDGKCVLTGDTLLI
jgi:leucyl aminopeptidase (aminopeptidase T)